MREETQCWTVNTIIYWTFSDLIFISINNVSTWLRILYFFNKHYVSFLKHFLQILQNLESTYAKFLQWSHLCCSFFVQVKLVIVATRSGKLWIVRGTVDVSCLMAFHVVRVLRRNVLWSTNHCAPQTAGHTAICVTWDMPPVEKENYCEYETLAIVVSIYHRFLNWFIDRLTDLSFKLVIAWVIHSLIGRMID